MEVGAFQKCLMCHLAQHFIHVRIRLEGNGGVIFPDVGLDVSKSTLASH